MVESIHNGLKIRRPIKRDCDVEVARSKQVNDVETYEV